MNYNGRLILRQRLVKKPESRIFPKGNIEGIIIDKDDKFIFINPLVQRKTSEIINNNKQTNVSQPCFQHRCRPLELKIKNSKILKFHKFD